MHVKYTADRSIALNKLSSGLRVGAEKAGQFIGDTIKSPAWKIYDGALGVAKAGKKLTSHIKKLPEFKEAPSSSLNKASKAFSEMEKIKVISLFKILYIPWKINKVVAQSLEAVKPWEHAEVFFSSLNLLKEVIDVPDKVVGVVKLFEKSFEAVSKATEWAPWLSLVSLVFSSGKLLFEGRTLWKNDQFDKRMERRSFEAIVKQLDRLNARLESEVKDQLESAKGAVSDADTMLLLKKFREEVASKNPRATILKSILPAIISKGRCGQKVIDHLQSIANSDDLKGFLEESNNKKNLLRIIEGQLGSLRKSRDRVALGELVEKLKCEFDSLPGASQRELREVSSVAYIEALQETKLKVLEKQYKVNGKALKREVDRVSTLYKERKGKGDQDAGRYVEGVVASLKGRAAECRSSSVCDIVSSVVGIVAASIFLAISFGVSCTPLAPIAITITLLLTCFAIGRYFYERSRKGDFELAIGIAEEKRCGDWIKKIDKVRRKEHRLGAAIAPDLLHLRRSVNDRQFQQEWKEIDLEKLKNEEAEAKKSSDAAKIEETRRRRLASEEYNKIASQVNRWRKQKLDHPEQFVA